MSETAAKSDLLLDADGIARAIESMAAQIRRITQPEEEVALVGVIRRGVPLAQRLRAALRPVGEDHLPIGKIDITLYRDDLSTLGPQPILGPTDLPFSIDNRTVILVDDVLYTGRTVRAALDAIVDFGRPRAVRLAVLVDRGHREYPIQPDVVGRSVDTTLNQIVHVHLTEIDGDERVDLVTR
jgi:pyrimidine operon attenuation protein/uracil phosphoribosyltransferase